MRTCLRSITRGSASLLATASITLFAGVSGAAPLAISDVPLFVQDSVAPMNMLVVGRDHKLYYEAYNDASDLDGDRILDTRYKGWQLKSPAPTDGSSRYKIDYYGYFDSFKCYTYSSGVFVPQSVTTTKTCSGQWSGDYLNYLTTTRLDALRKVLYGGRRSTDDGTTTILERSHVPQDAHSWGKEYNGYDIEGYYISDYTPLSEPTSDTRHLFANTTPLTSDGYNEPPRLRFLENRTNRIWNWVSKERPVAGTSIDGGGGVTLTTHTNDLYVRVRVCVTGLLESNCQQYPDGNYKPIGLLQEFGENDSMYFGLMSGSYAKNTSGGVLRRAMGSIRDEVRVSSNGTFTGFNGIIRTLNRLRVTGFGGSHEYSCGWITTRAINEGDCQMWGNPVAEMMYESLRYFAGREDATEAFEISVGQGQEGSLPGGGLPVATWDNPYEDRPVCSKPFQTVVSDINPSYDGNLPGNAFGLDAPSDTLGTLNVSTLGQTIWDNEYGGSRNIFIGQSGGTSDGAPTPKTVTSFGNIRGLAPEEPTKQGTFYSASVAYHGRTTNLDSLNSHAGPQNVNTFSVALASPLPKIEIPVGNNRFITLVPFAKSVGGSGISPSSGSFQPTNQIVDFYVQDMAADGRSGTFRVNFEDVEQGADHDMDAIAIYSYSVNAAGVVTVSVTSEYAAGGIIQHMGYIVSGSTADGTYLVVRDVDTSEAQDINHDYFLDTPAAFTGTPPAPPTASGWDDGAALPTTIQTRTFTAGTTPAASLLRDPLWYAAKWGGFEDTNNNNRPDLASEWDADGDGVPDNYFLVTNALTLSEQLRAAFEEIIERVASASSASVNSGSVSSDTMIYQARFNSGTWAGEMLAYPVNANGSLGTVRWDAADEIPAADSRRIITVNPNGTPVPFRWGSLDASRKSSIQPDYLTNETLGEQRLDYLRGDRTHEVGETNPDGLFRERRSLLGDIVSSSPLFVGAPFFSYPDSLESQPYSAFRAAHANRRTVVYAGANDGMLHAFDGEDGEELLAFVPSASFRYLRTLSNPAYTHRFFVDGSPNMRDVFYSNAWHTVLVGGMNAGGQEVYALDVTNPNNFSEANATNLVLWEFTDRDRADTDGDATEDVTGDPDLGYTYSQPAIVRLQNGRWAAIFGNGYNNTANDGSASTTGNAVLFIVDIQTGELIRKIDTLEGTNDDPLNSGRPNGLATPAIVDLNGDRIVDYVYAGDLFGNMWKFDIRGSNANNWRVAFGTAAAPEPLFTALGSTNAAQPNTVTRAQPITSRPEVVRGPRGVGMMVLFGTGKYMEITDDQVATNGVEIQTYYGLWDQNSGTDSDRILNRTALLQQNIIYENSVAFGSQNYNVRVTSNHPLVSQRGWYLDLLSPPSTYRGERQVSNTSVRGSRVIFTTLIPNTDPCEYGGSSWLMELDAISGARLTIAPFDLNNDGRFDGGDMATIVVNGESIQVPITGLQPDVGITPEPGILFSEGGALEYLYSPGTTGDIKVTVGSTDPRSRGRQSWRQVR